MTDAEREVYLPEVFNRAFREALSGPDADIALAVAVNAVRDATLEAVRERVEAEEELDGPMPDAVWDRMRDSRQAAAEMLRAAVSATKRNILAALYGMGA
jgi:hypothetical protein